MSLADWLGYDPETGRFWWKRSRGGKLAGSEAGHLHRFPRDGRVYRMIRFGGKPHVASRLAFEPMTGQEPPVFVDHEDGDSTNDRWANLRAATRNQNGRYRNLGRFATVRDAKAAYDDTARELHQEFVRL